MKVTFSLKEPIILKYLFIDKQLNYIDYEVAHKFRRARRLEDKGRIQKTCHKSVDGSAIFNTPPFTK